MATPDPRIVEDDRIVEDEEPLPAPAAPAKPPDGAKETAMDFLVGGGSGASFEFDDEIAGGLRAVGDFMVNLGGGQGLDKAKAAGGRAYTAGRDEYRQRKELAAERSPTANFAGKVGGAVASSLLIPGGAAGGAARVGGRLAAEGAVAGLGASEAEDAAGMAKDAAAGAATGLAVGHIGKQVVGGAGAAARYLGEKAAPLLQEAAERSQVAATGQSLKQAAKLPGGVRESAAVLKKHKIGGALAGKARIAREAAEATEQLEAKREQLSRQFSRQGVEVDGKHIARLLRDEAAGLAPKPQWMERQLATEAEDIAAAKTAAGRMRAGKLRAKAEGPGIDEAEGLEAMAGGKTAAGRLRAKGLRKRAETSPDAQDLEAMAQGAEAGAERQAGRLRQRAAGPGTRTADDLEAQARGVEAQARRQAEKLRSPGEPVRIESNVNKAQRDLLESEAQYFESRGRMSFDEANQARKQWMENARFGSDAQQAQGAQKIHRMINHAMENAANGVMGGSGRAFREAGREMAHTIAAQGGAEGALLQGAQRMPGDVADVGFGMYGGVKGVAAMGVRRLLRSRGNSMLGAGQEAASRILGRAAPVTGAAGRGLQAAAPVAGMAAARLSAAEGAERVKQAFLEGGEESAAQAHYLESMTNPEYRSETNVRP